MKLQILGGSFYVRVWAVPRRHWILSLLCRVPDCDAYEGSSNLLAQVIAAV